MSKRKLWLFAIVMLVFLITTITSTFALFETNASGDSELDIGRWVILLNGDDVKLNETITLDDFTYSATSHTADGKFAPGRDATFEIEIDATDSDVSVQYDISIDDSALFDHPNIDIVVTDLDTNTVINSVAVNGVIYLSDASRVKHLEIALEWNDNPLYDEEDTELIGGELNFDISANFIQYTGA